MLSAMAKDCGSGRMSLRYSTREGKDGKMKGYQQMTEDQMLDDEAEMRPSSWMSEEVATAKAASAILSNG